MKEYKYVQIELEGVFPPKKPKKDYHTIIDEHVDLGWRLVQIFSPVVAVGPFAAYYCQLPVKNVTK